MKDNPDEIDVLEIACDAVAIADATISEMQQG
jgi:hypothetical protein